MESLNNTINIEYDENYNPCHKTISISSMESAPSFYTGKADSCSSLCDPDEIREPLFFDDPNPNPYELLKMKQRTSISIPFEDLDPYSYQSFIIPDKQIQEPIPSNSNEEINSYSDEFNFSTCENIHQKMKQTTKEQEKEEEEPSSTLKVLSQDEKRANHIASEQKRRQNIRNGFKQLSDIIPTLKNMPNSKSTILFKAADYIKHNEKRNKILQDRLKHLQRKLVLSTTISQQYPTSTSSSSKLINHHYMNQQNNNNNNIYHSTQEKIRLLQQQLLHQHQLLLKHNIISSHTQHFHPPKSSSSSTSAIVMPVQDDDHPFTTTYNSTPCLHIPADEDYCQESIQRERLLSCGKLNFN